MNDQARQLMNLSRCDHRIHKLNAMVNSEPEELTSAKHRLEKENKALEKLTLQNGLILKRIKEHQEFINAEREKLGSMEKQLNSPQGQKVFVKVKNNISLLNKFVQQSETIIAELKAESDAFRADIDAREETRGELGKEIESIESRLGQISGLHKKEVAELEKERPALLEGIKPQQIWKYSKLKKRGIMPPVAEVSTNHCSACSMTFPPQHYQLILVESVGECSNCMRILVHAPPAETEAESPEDA